MRFLIPISLGILILFGSWACQESGTSKTQVEQSSSDPIDSGEGELQNQLTSLNAQIERSPDNWALFQDRSLVHYSLGEVDQAVADVQEAIKIYDDSPDLHYLRGIYAMVQGDTSIALSEFQLAGQYGSGSPDTYYQVGQIFFFRKDYPKALGSYQNAARLDSLDPMFPFAMGFLEESRGRYQEALKHYTEALNLDPAHEKTLLQLHDIYLVNLKNESLALSYNQRVLDSNPTHPLAQYNLGNSHYRTAMLLAETEPTSENYPLEVNLAVQAYSISINKGQDGFAEPYFYRGHCYFLGERLDLALEDLKKAIEIDPAHAPAHFYLGSIYEYYQEPETALQHYRAAMASNPDFPGAREAVLELGGS